VVHGERMRPGQTRPGQTMGSVLPILSSALTTVGWVIRRASGPYKPEPLFPQVLIHNMSMKKRPDLQKNLRKILSLA